MGRRTWLWFREQFAFVAVFLVLAVGFVYLAVDAGRWGRSSGLIAAAALLAAVLRAVLPTGLVGQLAVRGRIFDTVVYLVLGGLLLVVDIRLHG